MIDGFDHSGLIDLPIGDAECYVSSEGVVNEEDTLRHNSKVLLPSRFPPLHIDFVDGYRPRRWF